MSGDADSNYTGDYDFSEVSPHYALDSVRQMGLQHGPRISELHEFLNPQSPGREQNQDGNITTTTTHRPDGIYVTSNGTMTVTDTDEYEVFLPANLLEQQGSDLNLFGELRIDLLPLQDGSYSYRSGQTTVEATTAMDDFGTRYFIEENTEPGVAPEEAYQWRGLGTGAAEFENHTFGNSYSEIRTLGERRIATPANTATTDLPFWGFENEDRTETLTSVFDKRKPSGSSTTRGPTAMAGMVAIPSRTASRRWRPKTKPTGRWQTPANSIGRTRKRSTMVGRGTSANGVTAIPTRRPKSTTRPKGRWGPAMITRAR